MKKPKLDGVLIEQQEDPRNYKISQFIPNVDTVKDEEFMLKLPEKQFIIDQGRYSACVGHAFALAKSILEYSHNNKWIDFDPFIIYGTRFPNEYIGTGMYSYQGAKALLKEGAFLRRDFGKREEMPGLKYTVDSWKSKNQDKVTEALNYTITGYSYVYNDNDIKYALKNGMVVSASFTIYPSFYKTRSNGVVRMPNTKAEKVDGYHQMCIIGWTKNNQWIVANSWGVSYGFKGIYLIPFGYPMNEKIAVSDNIYPAKYKAKTLSFIIGKSDYIVDDTVKQFDVVPYLKQDRTYVSVRFITEALGCSVEWIEELQKVIIRSEEAIITLTIGDFRYTVDGKQKRFDVAPEIVNDRTMLPIRFIAEALNCKVSYIDKEEKVIITAL